MEKNLSPRTVSKNDGDALKKLVEMEVVG